MAMDGAPGPEETARNIERALRAALAKRGVGGRVVVREDKQVELRREEEPPVSIEIGELFDQWDLLPAELRLAPLERVAIRLEGALVADDRDKDWGVAGHPRLRSALLFAATALMVVVVVAGLYRGGFFGARGAADAAASATASTGIIAPAVGDDRAAQACEATRQRIYAGAGMGIEPSGWVVELWLGRAKKRAGLVALVEEAVAAPIAELPAPVVDDRASVEVDDAIKTLEAIRVTFQGTTWARAFFEPGGRKKYIELARRWMRSWDGAAAALQARCVHLDKRDVTAWFAGGDLASLAAVIWYRGGTAQERPALREEALLAKEQPWAVLNGAVDFDITAIRQALHPVGGRLVEEKAGVPRLSITLPLGGPTRGARLARELVGRAPRLKELANK